FVVSRFEGAVLWGGLGGGGGGGEGEAGAAPAPVAALLRHRELAVGTTVAVLSGGNLDPGVAARVSALAALPVPDLGERQADDLRGERSRAGVSGASEVRTTA
ncbi:hypothetical protein MXD58_020615, partial [Frankia sp. AgKG'84/4]|nr:hypothetical protein [Frankia sp. AgKG'84/4]